MLSFKARYLWALALAVGVGAPGATHAEGRLGATPETGGRAVAPQLALGEIAPALTFTNASFSTSGVGLRNRLLGSIEAPGNPTTPPRAAYLYWAVITNGAVPAAARSPKIARRTAPTVAAKPLTAVQVGTGTSPCWGGTAITVYRATVPASVAKGGGVYEISFPSGASGTPNNQNPWFGSGFPMLEGASLVLIYNGENTVSLYDNGLAGKTLLSGTLTYSLRLPRTYSAYLR